MLFLLFAVLTNADDRGAEEVFPPKLSSEEAFRLVKEADLEKAWPAFAENTSLLDLAFANQRRLPTPAGALAQNAQILSLEPRVLLIDDFLTPEECEFLKASALYRMEPALVVQSSENWYNKESQTRNNEQVWFSPTEERLVPLLRHILKRIHRTARVTDEYAEALQVGRYNVSQKYEAHGDSDPAHQVARPATMITYLNDVEGGGETVFPNGRSDCHPGWKKHPKTGEDIFGARLCCETPELDDPQTVRIKPKKGRAVLFFNHHPNGDIDPKSKHLSCPVTQGEKWIAQRWLRYAPYQRISYATGPGRDPRFDGVPGGAQAPGEASASAPRSPHFRTISNGLPRVYLAEGHLSNEECDALMELARPLVKVSDKRVRALKAGEKLEHLPEEAIIDRATEDRDGMLSSIRMRSHLLTRYFSNSTSVGMRIGRWGVGSAEKLHVDSSPPKASRPATVFVFLNDVEEGGEIIFPKAEKRLDPSACSESLEACCRASKVKVRPRKGDALLIYSHTMDGILDKASVHASCPVVQGERWVAERRFRYEDEPDEGVNRELAEDNLDKSMKIIFRNMGTSPLKVFWFENKKEVFMDDIPSGPGFVKEFNTFEGHRFHIRDADGNMLKEVVAKRGNSNIRIGTVDEGRMEI